jgi:hypothetical protein
MSPYVQSRRIPLMISTRLNHPSSEAPRRPMDIAPLHLLCLRFLRFLLRLLHLLPIGPPSHTESPADKRSTITHRFTR